MKTFLLGVLVTLAVLYPTFTKNIFGSAVDTAHVITTNAIESANETNK